MSNWIEEKCQTRDRCVRRKSFPQKAPMASIHVSSPLELVCMDFLSIEPDGKGVKDVLVITDHFTKYAIAVPTKNQTAKVVAEALWDNLISIYGWPERLHSDQGRDFQSKVIVELCKLGNISKSRTTPYHPQGNPIERYNRTLLNMLGTLNQQQKSEWRKYVKPLTHAYNCTVNETTGFTPYFLMFGRHAKLPIDIAFGTDPDIHRNSGKSYVSDLKERLRFAYELARKNITKSQLKNQSQYNKHAHAIALEDGDRVLVRKLHIQGKQKLADRWEEEVYIVKQCMPGTSTYIIQDEEGRKPTRTLHRNLLLPIGALSPLAEPEPVKPRKIKTRSVSRRLLSDDESSDDEVSIDVDINQLPPIVIKFPNGGQNEILQKSNLRPDAQVFVPNSVPPQVDDQQMVNSSIENEHELSTVTEPHNVSHRDSLYVQPDQDQQHELYSVSQNDSQFPSHEVSPDHNESCRDSVNTPQTQDEHHNHEDAETVSEPDVQYIERNLGRPKRTCQPPQRMTFDVLGEPTARRFDMHFFPN